MISSQRQLLSISRNIEKFPLYLSLLFLLCPVDGELCPTLRTRERQRRDPCRQDSGHHMKPWLKTMQRRLLVKGRQGTKVTMTVMVYRDTVWVTTFDEPFSAESILELAHVDSMIEVLTWAAEEARRYQDKASDSI